MNYFQTYSLSPHATILAAWDSQVAESVNTPWFEQILADRGVELFLQFSKCYAELRALPRNARRVLQRQLARSHNLTIPAEWQRKLAGSFAGAALLLALGQGYAQANTINITAKTLPGINNGDGKCSLIEAIENANDTTGVSPHPDCGPGDPTGADTIVIPAKSSIALTAINNSSYGDTGLPVITSDITIEGNGVKLSRGKTAPPMRIFAVASGGTLTLNNATISGGKSDSGGAIYNYGYLYINNSIITGNSASHAGGGVYNYKFGNAFINHSTISGNTAHLGGGLYNDPFAYVRIDHSTMSKNVGYYGGAIYNYGTAIVTNGSIITGNKAFAGGGLFSRYYLTVDHSTVSKNSATGLGGGISNGPGPYSSLVVTNSSLITGNKAGVAGGGVANLADFSLVSSTITANSAKKAGGGVFNFGYHKLGTNFDYTFNSNVPVTGNKAKYGPNVYDFTYVY